MPETAAAEPRFDGVVLAAAESAAVVGGMTLAERALFTLARAGAQRLAYVGDPDAVRRVPPVPLLRIVPDDAAALAAWRAGATLPVIGFEAAAVVDVPTIVALRDSDGGARRLVPVPWLWRLAARPAPLPHARSGAARAVLAAEIAAAAPWEPPPHALLRAAGDATGRADAERALYERLGRSGDGWFTRHVDRRVSRALSALLVPTGITPNQITLGSIALGIIAGMLFASGAPATAIAAAVLFLASTIVDGCDGEIARLTFRESRLGALLDVVGDNVVHLFLFTGIALGLYRRHPEPRLAAAGVALLLGVLLAMAAVYVLVVHRRPTAAQQRLFEAFASREFAYLLVVLAVIDRLEWFLWLSAAGTYAFVGGLLILARRR